MCEGNTGGTSEIGLLPIGQDLESPESDGLNCDPPLKVENPEEHIKTTSVEQPAATLASSDKSSNGKEESKAICTDNQASETEPSAHTSSKWFLFKCVLKVKKEGHDFLIEMHWVEGQNRDLMNQLCTYLKNQIFRLVTT